MLRLIKPSEEGIRGFLTDQQSLPFSYREVGATRHGQADAPRGYPVNHYRVQLGTGAFTYARAVNALQSWTMYALCWTHLFPAGAPVSEGVAVCVLARHFGVWSLNANRIIYVIEEREKAERYGFAFGTLPGHSEQGEERFTIERRQDDTVWYELLAFAKPKHILARVGYPLTRLVQKRFARASGEAMRAAVAETPVHEQLRFARGDALSREEKKDAEVKKGEQV